MLVLSRQRDESIIIGDNVVVTIVDIRGDKVRLGIDAPSEVPVHRREVYEAIQRENLRASQLDPKDTRNLGGARPVQFRSCLWPLIGRLSRPVPIVRTPRAQIGRLRGFFLVAWSLPVAEKDD